VERFVRTLLLVILFLSSAPLAQSQGFLVEELNKRVSDLLQQGRYTDAFPVAQEAVAVAKKSLRPDDTDLAKSLNNMAEVYRAQGRYADAERLFKKALTMRETTRPDDADLARLLNNMAELYIVQDRYADAETLLKRALMIWEATRPDHPDYALALNNMAVLCSRQWRYAEANVLFARCLKITEDTMGSAHPRVSEVLHNLTPLTLVLGRIDDTVAFSIRAHSIDEYNMERILLTGFEEQKRMYMRTMLAAHSWAISLHALYAPSNLSALRLAISSVLRWKGRVLDSMRDTYGATVRRLADEDRKTLAELQSVTGQLATLVNTGPGAMAPEQYRQTLDRLEAIRGSLQEKLSQRSGEVRAETRTITLEAVQQAIPKDSALVELTVCPTYDAAMGLWVGEAHYVAYVLWPDRTPAWVDLGEAGPIEQAAAKLREALGDHTRTDVVTLARALDDLTMRRIRRLLGPTRTVLLSPDGVLNLIPFGALVDEKGDYLVKEFSFVYLTSGRDILQMQVAVDSKTTPIIIANPDYSLYGVDFPRRCWPSLPGTSDEAESLKGLLPDARVLEWEEASEEKLKEVSGPQILHIATHGFFKDRTSEKGTFWKAPAYGASWPIASTPLVVDNPLLRSGLVLAGANSPAKEGREDGIITALEMAHLDLWGTKLVVLSACETGTGEVQTGEGVYGLRRSLVLAGSQSQVMSLWKVSDVATQLLMVAYYKGLRAGEGRSEALRKAQVAMLESRDRSHPYFWASFIASGDWRRMDWKARRNAEAP